MQRQSSSFVPVLSPTNQMSYDTAHFFDPRWPTFPVPRAVTPACGGWCNRRLRWRGMAGRNTSEGWRSLTCEVGLSFRLAALRHASLICEHEPAPAVAIEWIMRVSALQCHAF